MINFKRLIPHLTLGFASLVLFWASKITVNQEIKSILINIFSNAIFFFIAYLFYDIIKQIITRREKKYLIDYIKNKIANDIFVALYFIKKIIHGYSLETNTLESIFSIINYSKDEINSAIENQNYLGFQIFKNIDEVHSLFSDVAKDNFILKYSSYVDTINIIRIANNLMKMECILKNENNFEKSAEKGIEFRVVNGKNINPENDEKYLLLKMTQYKDRFVVYDSGYFDKQNVEKLLNRYLLKKEVSYEIAALLLKTFSLMKYWIPGILHLTKNESRFKIIKNFFSPNTNSKTKDVEIYVADIVNLK